MTNIELEELVTKMNSILESMSIQELVLVQSCVTNAMVKLML